MLKRFALVSANIPSLISLASRRALARIASEVYDCVNIVSALKIVCVIVKLYDAKVSEQCHDCNVMIDVYALH